MGNKEICCCDDNKGGDFRSSRAIKVNRRGPQYYQKKDPLNQSTMITYSKNYPPYPSAKKVSSGIKESDMRKQESQWSSSNIDKERMKKEMVLQDLEVNEQDRIHKNLTQGFQPQPEQLYKKQSMPDYFEINRHNKKINDASILGIKDLNPNVKETFEKNKFLIVQDLKKQPVYWQTLPDGFYKYVRSDGSLYIGHFENGKAHGRGIYIFTDGSYYQGMFRNDMADTYGSYYSKDLIYKGEFKENTFEGKGIEKGPRHSFNGLYMKGEKYHGVFQWKDEDGEYTYKGSFDQEGRFFGEGTLTEPTGTYQGYFKYGLKHGEGTYYFKNDYKYKGTYRNNVRQGPGKLINPVDQLVFEGQFQEGLPVTQNLKLKKMASMFSRNGSIHGTYTPTK